MYHRASHRRTCLRAAGALCAAFAIGTTFTACVTKPPENAALKVRYKDLGAKDDVPAFMQGTVWEQTERMNDEFYASSTYGLVGRLRGTGDCTVSLTVREWMIKQMVRHGYGNKLIPGYDKIGAGEILRNPGYSIVRVDGLIPPGARKGDFFDATVTALPGNKTSSLTGGTLFESDLTALKGNSPDIDSIHVLAKAKGPIVVNPAYALTDATDPAAAGAARMSLRAGTVMDGGIVTNDRPIILRLRQPQRSLARRIENRINHRFQTEADFPRKNTFPITNLAAAALDEGLVEIYVPRSYNGDWEHFVGVCEQLYLSDSAAVQIAKAKELAEEAVKPGAPLLEISYGLEGIGEPALQYVLPLMAHPAPDVSFAMARAAVFMGDESGAAHDTLLRIARSDDHQFQLAAIDTLGKLKPSAERNQKLRILLESKNTLARTAAYNVLSRNRDTAMSSRVIAEKFSLDIVPAGADPLVYASRSGIPRIAVMGPKPRLALPLIFTTLNGRLMISSQKDSNYVTLFYRDDVAGQPIQMLSRADIAEIIARLGGAGAIEEAKFQFTYGEIVAIVQLLTDQKKVVATLPGGKLKHAQFIFDRPRRAGEDLEDAAPVIENSRPNTADASSAPDAELPAGPPRVATK